MTTSITILVVYVITLLAIHTTIMKKSPNTALIFMGIATMLAGSIFLGFILEKIACSYFGLGIKNIWAISSVLSFSGFGWLFLQSSFAQVPQNHVWLLTIMGKHVDILDAGPNFISPFFSNAHEIYKGIQEENLFSEEKVDFKDATSRAKGQFLYEIVDPESAFYNLEDAIKTLRDKLEEATRGYLSERTLEEAISEKADLGLKEVLDRKAKTSEETENNPLYQEIITTWGIKVTSLLITDIELPPELEKVRDQIMKKSKDIELAELDKKLAKKEMAPAKIRAETEKAVIVTEAEGKSQAIALEGDGHAQSIRELKSTGLHIGQAALMLVEVKKWDKISPGASTIITDGSGDVNSGARFGAGFNSQNQKGK